MACNNGPASAAGNAGRFREAVCIEANRIFDSCSDKDCLEDLQCFFTEEDQAVLDNSVALRTRCVEVLDLQTGVEEIPFNRGFFAVDLIFYFRVSFNAYASCTAEPVVINGLAFHQKRVVLYGGEGTVKTFRSDRTGTLPTAAPVATVKVAQPVALSCRLVEVTSTLNESLGTVPAEVINCYDGDLVYAPAEGSNTALVTIGVFSVVALERSVQIMVPVYDYSVPEKDCSTTQVTEDPCEMFRSMEFPVEEFYPEQLTAAND